MILTVTLNPAIDISYSLPELLEDSINRVNLVSKTAGGKGLNVARVLSLSGEEVCATGLYGGVLSIQISHELNHLGIRDNFLKISGETRNNIAILHEGKQTEILEAGPTISKNEAEEFLEVFSVIVKQVSVVTISGSLPQGLPMDYYYKMIEYANKSGVKVILDGSGEAFESALSARPYAIKPNHEEIADLLKEDITQQPEKLRQYLSSKMFEGIPLIMVSLGAKGALIKRNNHFYLAKIPIVKTKNAVGSGDATVAGLAASLSKGSNDEQIIKHSMTLGVLNAMNECTGVVNMERYQEIYDQVSIDYL